MENLRRLTSVISDNGCLSAIINAIATMWSKLEYCAIIIKRGCQLTSEDGLLNLKQLFACPNLYFLGISIQLGKLVTECMSNIVSSKLVRLHLLECEIEDDPMWILGKLSALSFLCLDSSLLVGEEMTCPALSFPNLKTLKLMNLPRLREWRVEQGAMALLSEVLVDCCLCLEMIPDGMSDIFTLKKLTIRGMPKLGKRVMASRDGVGEGEDFHKVRHVS